jgi:hypothetical protein
MKKAIMSVIILGMTIITCYAPELHQFYIVNPPTIKKFDPMLYSFQKIESNFDADTINRLGYGGILQIGQEMVDEANRLCELKGNPTRFVLDDRLDVNRSTHIWYIVQEYWNPKYELKRACKIWNPLASTRYYNKIKAVYLTL